MTRTAARAKSSLDVLDVVGEDLDVGRQVHAGTADCRFGCGRKPMRQALLPAQLGERAASGAGQPLLGELGAEEVVAARCRR